MSLLNEEYTRFLKVCMKLINALTKGILIKKMWTIPSKNLSKKKKVNGFQCHAVTYSIKLKYFIVPNSITNYFTINRYLMVSPFTFKKFRIKNMQKSQT